MAMIGTRLVEKMKDEALRLGTRGVRWVVESTATALKALDRLQEWLPEEPLEAGGLWESKPSQRDSMMEQQRREPSLYRPPPAPPAKQVSPDIQATAEMVLDEARAVRERIKKAQPATRPLKVSVEADAELATPAKRGKSVRTQGRKTTAVDASPKRVAAPTGGFKAKRGQKHKH